MKRWKALALAGVGLVGAAALISSSAVLAAPKDNNVTLVWWHNANQGAGEGPVGAGGEGVPRRPIRT